MKFYVNEVHIPKKIEFQSILIYRKERIYGTLMYGMSDYLEAANGKEEKFLRLVWRRIL